MASHLFAALSDNAPAPQSATGPPPATDHIRADELLTTAAFRGEVDRVRHMLDRGAVSTAHDTQLLTAMHWAASMGHCEVVELLIERGADPNARARDGNSPLHMAAREGDADLATLLLEAGASPGLCNSEGRTPLDLALTFADDEVELIDLLRRALTKQENALLTAKREAAETAPPRRNVVMMMAPEGTSDDPAEALAQAMGAMAKELGAGAPPIMVDSGCGP